MQFSFSHLVHRLGPLVQMVMQPDAIGEKYGERAFQVAGSSMPQWRTGELLSGMSCAAIVAGLGDASESTVATNGRVTGAFGSLFSMPASR